MVDTTYQPAEKLHRRPWWAMKDAFCATHEGWRYIETSALGGFQRAAQ